MEEATGAPSSLADWNPKRLRASGRDGWDIPVGRSVIAEVYPRLWSRGFALENRTADQHDAYCIAAWLQRADYDGSLAAFLKPALTPSEQSVAQVEGWILGVPGLVREPVLDGESRAGH
jgi:hypothetical protein